MLVMAKRRKIVDQHGNEAEGDVINVQETTERWADIRLVDGTTFRIKVVVDEVVRLDGKKDEEGNPIYSVRTHNVIDALESVDTVKYMKDR